MVMRTGGVVEVGLLLLLLSPQEEHRIVMEFRLVVGLWENKVEVEGAEGEEEVVLDAPSKRRDVTDGSKFGEALGVMVVVAEEEEEVETEGGT